MAGCEARMNDDQFRSLLNDSATAEATLSSLIGRAPQWDRLIAIHPKASGDVQIRLAVSADRQTRQAVEMNPQTPKYTLLKPAPTFHGEFFTNPVFALLLLEDPDLLNALPITVIKNYRFFHYALQGTPLK